MNPLPDIVVLDFCEWLKNKLKLTEGERPSTLDIFMCSWNNYDYLKEYAHEFLESNKSECRLKTVIQLFFNSKEYYNVINDCQEHYHDCRDFCHKHNDVYDYIDCPYIRRAFHCFLRNYQLKNQSNPFINITADDLAWYTRRMFLYGDSDEYIKQQPPMLYLVNSSSVELSEELNFFDWLDRNTECPSDVCKMPYDIFKKHVDGYISECKKTEVEKKNLLKSYQQSGWEALLEKFQVLFRLKGQKNKNLHEVIERYFSHHGGFKCIILPLSDPESQSIYHSLIRESWGDLNSCSGDCLDIYYSEADNGKSGFDIAKRVNALPRSLTLKAPCFIIWKHSMNEAQYIPINGLDNLQIVELVKSIVENIRNEKNLNEIIKEATDKVKELQNENRNISNYYAPVITGDSNIVGNNNTIGTGNVSGSSNTITGNSIQTNMNESFEKILEDFESAISAINNSQELDANMKIQLSEIVETAKTGVYEQSTEKQERAKTAFGYVKTFLTKIAPDLVVVLASMATIATFFGINI